MLKPITIAKISHQDKVSKAGKAYVSCGIMIKDKNDQDFWFNGFGDNTTRSFQEGQTVELDVYEDDYGWKFKVPKETHQSTPQNPGLEQRVRTLETELALLRAEVAIIRNTPKEPSRSDYDDTQDIRVEDTNF